MAVEKDEDFGDLIQSQTGMDWDLIMAEMHKISTEELMVVFAALELYVNKKLAQEIAGRKDAVFHLRKLIQDGQFWRSTGSGKGWSPIHAIHILPLIKSNEALQLLLDTIRYKEDELDNWLTESVPSLMVAFGEDTIGKLKEFAFDETLESFVRGTVSTALTTLAKKFPSSQSDIKKHLIELINTSCDPAFVTQLAEDLASFHDPFVLPEIYRVFEEERNDIELFVDMDEINSIFEGIYTDLEKNEFERHTFDPLEHFSRKNIVYLHSINYEHEDEGEKEEDFAGLGEDDPESEMDDDIIKKEKIGRNDPCPCGSGKKYKKCCMGKEKS